MKQTVIRIATRKSPLALWQARFVGKALLQLYPQITMELIGLLTEADKLLTVPLAKIGGKSLFVKELETALLENKADIAVHSLKDLPAELPDGLTLAAICKRADARDVFVANNYATLAELPPGATIATSSLRRQCQLQALRPDLEIVPLRGNVDTRLQKLDEGNFAAIILAAAGLKRLKKIKRIRQYFTLTELLPAVGQGAIGIECRRSDNNLQDLLMALNHLPTSYCVTAERAMNYQLQGSCQTPIAAHATFNNQKLHLRGLVGSPDGKQIIKSEKKGEFPQAEAIGKALAADLLAQGAEEILRRTRCADQ